MNYKGMNSPISKNIKNPLKKGDDAKLKAHRKKNMESFGIKT
jgi:hypothetical protein